MDQGLQSTTKIVNSCGDLEQNIRQVFDRKVRGAFRNGQIYRAVRRPMLS